MKNTLIIGSGISGLTCAIECAQLGIRSILVSPYPSERSQSVMAAGGINAVLNSQNNGDTPEIHAQDTLNGGCNIASISAVKNMCFAAPKIVSWLESIGTVFSRDKTGKIDLRAMGGQSYKRTAYAGASTGKQIITALIQEVRKYECTGLIERRLGLQFHSAFINDGKCFGAIFFDEFSKKLEPIYADNVVMATGGLNGLFGKTTGSFLCDGYATGKLFTQGVTLKNLEFIQYHPTTIETIQKKILISESARGEGGRLYYLEGNKRVYFMEEKFGPKGNLMPRDIVSKSIYDAPSQVFLDITHIGEKNITERLSEIKEICHLYAGLDVCKNSIPVSPSIHFFMGGFAVDQAHQTNIRHLYAIGECASIYHGANRLGGNSLLAAIYSGKLVASAIYSDNLEKHVKNFDTFINDQQRLISESFRSKSKFSAVYIKQELAKIMNDNLGIVRTQSKLQNGIEHIEYYLSIIGNLVFNNDISPYQNYSLNGMLPLARAILTSANERKETRGSHIREDFPDTNEKYRSSTVISYQSGKYKTQFLKEV